MSPLGETSEAPQLFVIYTVKGFGLPFQGHKDNHAGQMTNAQMAAFLDSDFADGRTQGRGYMLQGAWAPAKNMTMKATYYLNDRDYDTAAEADYRRLQFDLNYKF